MICLPFVMGNSLLRLLIGNLLDIFLFIFGYNFACQKGSHDAPSFAIAMEVRQNYPKAEFSNV
jgi:hypothetical protein